MTSSNTHRLFVDIETYSDVDISKAGACRYTASPNFTILLLAYAWDEGQVEVLDLTDPEDKEDVLKIYDALLDEDVIKVAHNCAFERSAFEAALGLPMPIGQWEDTMILAAYNGLPMSLDAAGEALGLQRQKLKEGVSLINFFCKPCKPTIVNHGRTRNLPEHAPEKWERFKAYCKRDVEVEQAIYYRLGKTIIPDWERQVFELDARINARGVLIDQTLARQAIAMDTQVRAELEDEMTSLTGIDNPNSVTQLKDWLATQGVAVDSLSKQTLADLLGKKTSPVVHRSLEIRKQLGKSSIKKYQTALDAVCPDGRLHGLMQYYGAGRTGRWAGRLLQPQNLPQNHLRDLDTARELVREGDLETLRLLYDDIPDVLSQLIRTLIVAPDEQTLLVADYSAIEARVLSILAEESWRLRAFERGEDIYCAAASAMFNRPVQKHGINAHLRQKGKIAELACGYGGGVNALKAFGADKMGLSDSDLQDIVSRWRGANTLITRFWRHTELAAKDACRHIGNYGCRCGPLSHPIRWYKDADALRCELPSGRRLSYWGAALDGADNLTYMSVNQTTRKWERQKTWGGKLVENIVQATARDCLAFALLRLNRSGFRPIFSVHDEIICEALPGTPWESLAEIMSEPLDWLVDSLRPVGLPADGYETPYYRKD